MSVRALAPRRARAPALVAVAALAVLGVAVMFATRSPAPPPSPLEQARAAARRFLDRYEAADGRVVRRDQGGDTVSEGQAYGMLLAVVAGDRERFDAAWRWTRADLQGPDGTLAWHWAGGRVDGAEPAADADLDAAHALLLGASRFGEPALRAEAARIARGVLGTETADHDGEPILVAGPWARDGVVVDPSYFAPRAYSALTEATGDARWAKLAAISRRLVEESMRSSGLPPDWARVGSSGAVPTGAHGADGEPVFGFDAARVPVRYAASCHPADRALAARMWPLLRANPGVATRLLDGTPTTAAEHPVALVASAAAASAAGERATAAALLDRATALDERRPSYYGAAWVALGRAMLTMEALGRC